MSATSLIEPLKQRDKYEKWRETYLLVPLNFPLKFKFKPNFQTIEPLAGTEYRCTDSSMARPASHRALTTSGWSATKGRGGAGGGPGLQRGGGRSPDGEDEGGATGLEAPEKSTCMMQGLGAPGGQQHHHHHHQQKNHPYHADRDNPPSHLANLVRQSGRYGR